MAQVPGTNIVAPVVPLDTADVHPTHEAKYGRGGYRTVASNAERDAITADRREQGMLVFVSGTGLTWRLGSDLTTWTEFTTGGGAPAAHASSHGLAGTDPITVDQAQVEGLSEALSDKASANSPTLNGLVTFSGDNSTTGSVNGDTAYFSTLVFANLTQQTTAFTSTLKTKLDGIAANANNYSLPNATTSTLGGVVVGTGLGVASGTVSVTYGTTAGTSCQGNDSRLSDARTPTSHVHGNITNAGAIGSTANLPIITTTSGVLTTGAFGTTANSFAQGNDARLVSDGNKGDITVGSSNTSWTINAGAVVTADIADSAVTTAKIAALAVTDAKVNDVAASKLTGTIATARLASGAASSSTYLRGDQTWAAVSGESFHPFLLAGM